MAMLKACRCGKTIPLGDRLCPQCLDKYGSSRGQKVIDPNKHSFYTSSQWRTVQAIVKARDYGLCVQCYSKGRLKAMHVVHHIVPIEEGEEQRFDISNLLCLCERCHQKVHKQYKTQLKDIIQKTLRELVARGIGAVKRVFDI